MSTRRLPRPEGYHWDQKHPVIHSENGKPSCRWCKGRVDPPRRSYCSAECAFNWERRIRWRLTRKALFEMRKGKCEKCGVDLRVIDPTFCRKQMEHARKIEHGVPPCRWRKYKPPVRLDSSGRPFSSAYWRERLDEAIAWVQKNKCVGRSVWDADHALALALGGDAYSFNNLRALCRACHVTKSKADAVLIAEHRRKNKVKQVDDPPKRKDGSKKANRRKKGGA